MAHLIGSGEASDKICFNINLLRPNFISNLKYPLKKPISQKFYLINLIKRINLNYLANNY